MPECASCDAKGTPTRERSPADSTGEAAPLDAALSRVAAWSTINFKAALGATERLWIFEARVRETAAFDTAMIYLAASNPGTERIDAVSLITDLPLGAARLGAVEREALKEGHASVSLSQREAALTSLTGRVTLDPLIGT